MVGLLYNDYVVELYKAQILSSNKGIALDRAVELVQEFDEDTNILNAMITTVRFSDYVYNKDITDFDYWWKDIMKDIMKRDINDLR